MAALFDSSFAARAKGTTLARIEKGEAVAGLQIQIQVQVRVRVRVRVRVQRIENPFGSALTAPAPIAAPNLLAKRSATFSFGV